MKKLFYLLFCLSSYQVLATITTAQVNGDWSEASVWDNGVPGCFDTIVIPAGIQVDITTTVDLEACADSIFIIVEGTINFQNGKKLKLPCNSDVVVTSTGTVGVGSGGGSSTYIEICSTQYWNASMGDLTGPAALCDGPCPGWLLPIELLFFEATMREKEQVVDLHWQTKSELNNAFFTIERSQNGLNWEVVNVVQGAGNSSVTLDYYSVDHRPIDGTSYYRLKQTDFNGDFSYSPIVVVNADGFHVSLYPNPVTIGESVVVTFPDGYTENRVVSVYAADGRLIKQISVNNNDVSKVFIPINDEFSSGFYLITAAGNTVKLVVR